MQETKKIKIIIGITYTLLLFIFLYLLFSKFTLEEITTYTGTFAGFVPSDDPEYLAVIVIHGLSGENYSGGRVSAPIFSNIMKQIYLLEDLKI